MILLYCENYCDIMNCENYCNIMNCKNYCDFMNCENYCDIMKCENYCDIMNCDVQTCDKYLNYICSLLFCLGFFYNDNCLVMYNKDLTYINIYYYLNYTVFYLSITIISNVILLFVIYILKLVCLFIHTFIYISLTY